MESILYVQLVAEHWEQVFATSTGKQFQTFQRVRNDIASSRVNKAATPMLDILLKPGFVDCKATKLGVSALSKLKKNTSLPPSLFFFNVSIFDADKGDATHRLAATTEEDRAKWLALMRQLGGGGVLDQSKRAAKNSTSGGGLDTSRTSGAGNRSPNGRNNDTTFDNDDDDDDSISVASVTPSLGTQSAPSNRNSTPKGSGARGNNGFNSPTGMVSPPLNRPIMASRAGNNIRSGAAVDMSSIDMSGFDDATMETLGDGEKGEKDAMDGEECRLKLGPCSVKFTNLFRFVEVALGFPGIIMIDAFGPADRSSIIYHKLVIYLVNLVVTYAVPLLLVQYVLQEHPTQWIQRTAIAATFAGLYIIPITYHILLKFYAEYHGCNVVDGFFTYKPSHRLRWTFSNFLQLITFFFEFVILGFMVLPAGLFKGQLSVEISTYWPYIDFKWFYWASVGLVWLSALILMMTSVLRGKTLYKFLKNPIPWHMMFLVGNVLFLPLVTIFLMSMWCDYTVTPAVFSQNTDLLCYGTEHGLYARLGFITLSVLIIQQVLLPPGSYKESISGTLDIMFTPVYLSTHALLKIGFAAMYVFYYSDNLIRVPALTGVSMFMLLVNSRLAPCCISCVNTLRDTIFLQATMTGTMSTAFLVYNKVYHAAENSATALADEHKWLFVYIWLSSVGCVFVFAGINYIFDKANTESRLASNLVEVQNNLKGNGLSSRALEPLISLGLSSAGTTAPTTSALVTSSGVNSVPTTTKHTMIAMDDSDTARKYVNQLIAMISHKAERVQFQGIWGLATVSLRDEDARVLIHEGGGSKLLLKNYENFSPLVQLETLAALANLTLSNVVAEAMVRQYNCLPLFMQLVNGHLPKHGLFALICIGNLTRRETFREQIRYANGIQTMVSCLMSHDYQKRKFGALALSNMALSVSEELDKIFRTRGLIDRIVKMAQRKEVETQREVVALVRNLACHSRLRPVLLNSGILSVLTDFRGSVHAHVAKWADEIYNLMQREINMGSLEEYRGADTKASQKQRGLLDAETITAGDLEYMKSMEPLHGAVEWDTWGSKVESLFSSLIDRIPSIKQRLECETRDGDGVLLNLSVCLSTVTFVQWKNDTRYIITKAPEHGYLTPYTTGTAAPETVGASGKKIKAPKLKDLALKAGSVISDSDSVVYTPKHGAQGNDCFSFVVLLGHIITKPCTLTITLDESGIDNTGRKARRCFGLLAPKDDDAEEEETDRDLEAGKSGCCGKLCRKKPPKKDDYDDSEYAEAATKDQEEHSDSE